jgi:DNA gyrase/topoisomerase IV subunit A
MDLVIKKIRAAKDKAEAKTSLMATPLKFSDRQAEAILEMRLRQLTGLDQKDLTVEDWCLQGRIAELEALSSDEISGIEARKAYMVGELTELGKRHGEARRSPIVEPPATMMSVATGTRTKAAPGASKPRFMKVDPKKGTVEQVKGPRGAIVLDSKDKVILMTEDGTLKKVPATFKGIISKAYSPIALAKSETEVSKRNYLVVFEYEDQLKAMTLCGEDLCKTTSSGKLWLPEGAILRYFGEGSFTVNWSSSRKKPTKLDLTLKQGKPGGKGIKVAKLQEIKL